MKKLNNTQKSIRSRNVSEVIECHICKKEETVQVHTYCWSSKLCLDCANRDYNGSVEE